MKTRLISLVAAMVCMCTFSSTSAAANVCDGDAQYNYPVSIVTAAQQISTCPTVVWQAVSVPMSGMKEGAVMPISYADSNVFVAMQPVTFFMKVHCITADGVPMSYSGIVFSDVSVSGAAAFVR